jgi:hypothetical protein
MPSLPASIFGFAAGIANADKIDVVTITHAAQTGQEQASHRSSLLGYPRFAVPGECFEGPDRSQKCYLPPAPTRFRFQAQWLPERGASRSRRYFGGRSSPLVQPEALSDLSGSAGSLFSHCNLRPWAPEGSTGPVEAP